MMQTLCPAIVSETDLALQPAMIFQRIRVVNCVFTLRLQVSRFAGQFAYSLEIFKMGLQSSIHSSVQN